MTKWMSAASLASVNLVILLSCAPPPPEGGTEPATPATEVDPSMVRSAIEEVTAQWQAGVENQDAAAVASLYSPDAIVLPPDSESIQGRQAIESLWNNVFQSGLQSADLRTVDLEIVGNTAYEVGEGTLSFSSDGGTAMSVVKYVVVWKKDEAGSWKLHRDIWNTKPSPAEE